MLKERLWAVTQKSNFSAAATVSPLTPVDWSSFPTHCFPDLNFNENVWLQQWISSYQWVHKAFSSCSCITIITLQIRGCSKMLWLAVMSQQSLFHNIIMKAPENCMARNFRGPSQAACLNCACILLVLLGKGQTSTPAQSLSLLFSAVSLFFHVHTSLLLLVCCFAGPHAPSLQFLLVALQRKSYGSHFGKILLYLRAFLKRLGGGGMDVKSKWHSEKLK